MQNVFIPPDRVQDPLERNVPGQGLGRDPCRTPMPWDGSSFAGFSSVEPWLPLGPEHAVANVRHESQDPDSMLSLYRKLLRVRRAHAALSEGSYRGVPAVGNLLVYVREARADRLLIALNLGAAPARFALPTAEPARLLLSTSPARLGSLGAGPLELAGNEGIIVALSPGASA